MRQFVVAPVLLATLCMFFRPICAVSVTRGDIVLLSNFDLAVLSPAGEVKGGVDLPLQVIAPNYRALASSTGYAVALQTTVEGSDSKVSIVRLGSRPKVLHTVRLPGFARGCAPYIVQTGSSLAFTEQRAAGGATVLSIYLDVACAVNLKPACSDGLQSAAYQNVDKQLSVWSWTISFKSGKLGPLRLGPRAALTFANDRCTHKVPRGLGVVNGVVYATYSFGTAPAKEVTNGFTIYKFVPKTVKGKTTAKLMPSYRFNTFAFAAVPTGPTSAIAAHLQLCSYARGRGKRCGGPFLPPGSFYQSIAAREGDAVALVYHTSQTGTGDVSVAGEVVRLSGAQLTAGDRGTTLALPDAVYFRLAVMP